MMVSSIVAYIDYGIQFLQFSTLQVFVQLMYNMQIYNPKVGFGCLKAVLYCSLTHLTLVGDPLHAKATKVDSPQRPPYRWQSARKCLCFQLDKVSLLSPLKLSAATSSRTFYGVLAVFSDSNELYQTQFCNTYKQVLQYYGVLVLCALYLPTSPRMLRQAVSSVLHRKPQFRTGDNLYSSVR